MRRRALALLWLVARSRGGGDGGGFLDFELSNGFELPVVGLGVGNLAHRSIPAVVSAGVERFGVRLVDTAMASNNEHLLQETLRRLPRPERRVVVVTKVWYTHLGYGRTRLAVEESLKSLGGGVDVVMLLHWPRCRDDIAWMRCAEEEAEAELRYRRAGPAPGADAWVGSWRALEEFYGAGRLAAIGVSNFDYDDMARLLRDAAVAPHVYQGNAWAFLFDPRLVELLREHRVRFVAYNVASGAHLRRDFDAGLSAAPTRAVDFAPGSTVDARAGHERRRRAPRGRAGAAAKLDALAAARGVDAATLVLKALAQTSRRCPARRRRATSPRTRRPRSRRAARWTLRARGRRAGHARSSAARTRRRRPPAGVVATFKNAAQGAVRVFWENESTGERVPVTADIAPGTAERLSTHPGHKFVAYRGAGSHVHGVRPT
ncbi:oxidoreductase [Aureococcus anophagefferens]|nr:oxidoreductase [Aureococcus anophagefferens]